MNPFSAIDLSKLPPPFVVEPIDLEVILADMLSDFRSRLPDFTIELESDPVYKLLEVAAYREFLLRARINDAGRSVMLAYAQKSDLDNLAALYQRERQVIEPEDTSETPTRPAIFEDDDRFRLRLQLSLEGYTTAGPEGAYLYHAFSADARVKDVSVDSPNPGDVVVTILSTEGDGTPSNELLGIVTDVLNADDIRPLTDHLIVQVPTILSYDIVAELFLFEGPDSEIVLQASINNLNRYVEKRQRLGQDIVRSSLFSALHTEGVQRVNLIEPAENIVIPRNAVASTQRLSVTVRGFDE